MLTCVWDWIKRVLQKDPVVCHDEKHIRHPPLVPRVASKHPHAPSRPLHPMVEPGEPGPVGGEGHRQPDGDVLGGDHPAPTTTSPATTATCQNQRGL